MTAKYTPIFATNSHELEFGSNANQSGIARLRIGQLIVFARHRLLERNVYSSNNDACELHASYNEVTSWPRWFL